MITFIFYRIVRFIGKSANRTLMNSHSAILTLVIYKGMSLRILMILVLFSA